MRIAPFLAVFALAAGFAGSASAGFDVCNKTRGTISVALGYHDKEHGWLSTGWWNIDPRRCESLLTGELNNSYYYIYAEDEHDGVWQARKGQDGGFFCIKKGKFTLHNDDFETRGEIDCEGNGAKTKQFTAVNTKDHTDFEYSLEE